MQTGNGTWLWRNPLPQGNPLNGVSCVDVLHCVLVGEAGTVLTTDNGGAAWLSRANQLSNHLSGVSCPTALVCVSVGDAGMIARSGDGGATWSTQVSGTVNRLHSVSCPSPATCFAVGENGTILATPDAGAHWNAQVSPQPTLLNEISCATSTACVAVSANLGSGTFVFTTNGGASWSAGNPTPTGSPLHVSCPSAMVCFAVAAEVWKTSDGGANWVTLHPNVGQSGIFGISCPTATTCLASLGLPNGTLVTTDGGMTWSIKSSVGLATAIACPSVTTCYTAGIYEAMGKTSDGGNSWQSFSSTVTSAPLIRVACPSLDTCFAIGNVGINSIRGPFSTLVLSSNSQGRTWLKRYEDTTTSAQDISCPDALTCFVVGTNSIASTLDGGSSWSQQYFDRTFFLDGISCPATTVCFAVGSMATGGSGVVVNTTNGGGTWYLKTPVGPTNLTSISCASIQTCVAVGYSGSTVRTTDGVNWSAGTSPTTQSLFSVDCASSTACLAAADRIIVTADGGATWSFTSSMVTGIGAVDCTTPKICFGIGSGDTIASTIDGGSNWSFQSTGTANRLYSVECPGTSVCFAVGYLGTILALPPVPRPEVAQPALPQTPLVNRLLPPPVPGAPSGPRPVTPTLTVKAPVSAASANQLQELIGRLIFGWLWDAWREVAVDQSMSAGLRAR